MMAFPESDVKYTYADYLTWPHEERWELIEGIPYAMAAPTTRHQKVLRKLCTEIDLFLRGKDCEVYPAPFSVVLEQGQGEDTVVEPDLSIICDPTKLDEKGCKGAPDFIIEILSPSTARHDRIVKFNKYLKAGVKEYWIVDPELNAVHAFILRGNVYVATVYTEQDTLPIWTLPGLEINLQEILS